MPEWTVWGRCNIEMLLTQSCRGRRYAGNSKQEEKAPWNEMAPKGVF